MPTYMIQASYNAQATTAMIKNPQDRAAAVRPMIEKLGGKMHGFWFALGECDVVAIVDLPDNVSAAAAAMAVGAGGGISAYRSTPLMSAADAVEAMKKAGAATYQAPR